MQTAINLKQYVYHTRSQSLGNKRQISNDEPDAKKTKPETENETQNQSNNNRAVNTILALASLAVSQENSIDNQLRELSKYAFASDEWRNALNTLIQDKIDFFMFEDSIDSPERHSQLSKIFNSIHNLGKILSIEYSDGLKTYPEELNFIPASEVRKMTALKYHIKNLIKDPSKQQQRNLIQLRTIQQIILNILSTFNPQTDNTAMWLLNTDDLVAKTCPIQVKTTTWIAEATRAINLKNELAKMISDLQTSLEKKLDEKERLHTDHIKQIEKNLETKFQTKLNEAITKATKSKTVQIESPEKKSDSKKKPEEETEKSSKRGWETVPPRKRSQSRGRSRTRRNGIRKIQIRPPSATTGEDPDVPPKAKDMEFSQKKTIAATLLIKSNTNAATVKSWFRESTIPGFTFNNTAVEVTQMTNSKGGFQRYKVLLKDFPVTNNTFEKIWNSFKVPFFVDITQWKGDPNGSTIPKRQRLSWYIGNLNPMVDFTEKLKDRVSNVYNGLTEQDEVVVVKLPRPHNLKEDEVQRTSAYCVTLFKTVDQSSMTDSDVLDRIEDKMMPYFKEHLKGIRINQWRGHPKLSDRGSHGPVDDL